MLRLEYEYSQPVSGGHLTFSIGGQRQFDFDLADIFFPSQSFHLTTHAVTGSVGYRLDISDTISLVGRLRAINTFRSKGKEFFVSEDIDFSPLQVLGDWYAV